MIGHDYTTFFIRMTIYREANTSWRKTTGERTREKGGGKKNKIQNGLFLFIS